MLTTYYFAPVRRPADGVWTPEVSHDFRNNTFVNIPQMGLHLPSGSYTVEFWSNCYEAVPLVAYATDDSTYNPSNRFLAHAPYFNGTLYFDSGSIQGNGRLQVGIPAAVGVWRHFALVTDVEHNNMRVYLDGKPYHVEYHYDTYKPKDDELNIGWWSYMNQYYRGQLGEFRIWSKARTDDEVANNYQSVLNGPKADLLAHWKLDDNVALGGQITDYSGNGYHGILTTR